MPLIPYMLIKLADRTKVLGQIQRDSAGSAYTNLLHVYLIYLSISWSYYM